LLAKLFLAVVILVPSVSLARRMTWVAVLVVYVAPADAVDWQGPWTRGNVIAGKNFFSSEAECRADTEARIKAIHEGMLAPILYRCVPFQESVP
jgi:hypothetical protein